MALSVIPDMIRSYKGQDYIFVGQLEDNLKELVCLICKSIVSEPLQTSCGHLFCRECYDRLGGDIVEAHCYIAKLGGPNKMERGKCPECNQDHSTVQDSLKERRVKVLQVRCANYRYGCQWVGNLEDEMQHRAAPNSCQFEEIKCPHGCGKIIQRMTQSSHCKRCSMRPHKCKHCGEEGQYWKMVNDHRQSCRRHPVPCPNGCDNQIPREDTVSYKLKKTVSEKEIKLQATEQRVHDLEKYLHLLKSETQAKTERIQGLEKDAKAKRQMQRIIKRVKKLIVFALGITVLFRLHPLYLISLLILGTIVYA